jgi:hypothetical protein
VPRLQNSAFSCQKLQVTFDDALMADQAHDPTMIMASATPKPRERELPSAATKAGEAKGVCARHAFVTGPVPWSVSSHVVTVLTECDISRGLWRSQYCSVVNDIS